MRTRTGPAWATARRILPSCGTWHSTSCRRMARRKRCAASFSGPDGTMPVSPASVLYSEVQLPWGVGAMIAGRPGGQRHETGFLVITDRLDLRASLGCQLTDRE